MRLEGIRRLLEILYVIVDSFARLGTSPSHVFCPLPSCDAMLYGSLLAKLQSKSLWPRKSPKEILISVSQLSASIADITLDTHPNIESKSTGQVIEHASCQDKMAFKSKVSVLMKNISPSPILHSHNRHMEGQAKALAFE